MQAAVDAARSGDSILLSPGVFAGGVTIDKSVSVLGAGAGKTTITGGGPVVTIGRYNAVREPTVSIGGVTITGGVTHSSSLSADVTGKPDVIALGGGVEIPPSAGFGNGATVEIRDTVITGNRVAPRAFVPSRTGCECPFALAGGGGVDNWGLLTLANTVVSDNKSGGPLASDEDAAGIYSPQGSLTLLNSTITGNRAAAVRPNGRFAEGGGIIVATRAFFTNAQRPVASFTMTGSRVTDNAAYLSAGFPSQVQSQAQAGGLLISGDDDCSQPDSGCVHATVIDSHVDGNDVTTQNATGTAVAFSGGVNNDGTLTLRDSSISNNHVTALAGPGSAAGASADSGGLGMGGYAAISRTLISQNSLTATSVDGDSSATFGGMSAGNPSHPVTVTDSAIIQNPLTASTNRGKASAQGAGVGHLDGPLIITRTLIGGNSGAAHGATTLAQGGGVANLAASSAALTLDHSALVGNALTSTGAGTPQGGGLYTAVPVTLINSVIDGNRPDQCFGPCPS
ncbi:MAG: hypothetical protein ABI083_15510 [Lapillicoccus sp.]